MPILWNTCSKKIEGRFDGKFFYFAPDERKLVQDPYAASHLQIQMEAYGLVTLPEFPSKALEEEKKIEGINNRWRWCDSIVRNWHAKNKERDSMKMAAELPNAAEADCALEAAELLKKLNELKSGQMDIMNAYLKDEKTQRAVEAAKVAESGIVGSGLDIKIQETAQG